MAIVWKAWFAVSQFHSEGFQLSNYRWLYMCIWYFHGDVYGAHRFIHFMCNDFSSLREIFLFRIIGWKTFPSQTRVYIILVRTDFKFLANSFVTYECDDWTFGN